MIEYALTDTMNLRNAAKVAGVLRSERLYVPTARDYGACHQQWVKKTEAELAGGTRSALLATGFGKVGIGTIVWRPNPAEPTVIDIRNISLAPDERNIGLGHFMLGVVTREAEQTGAEILTVDTKVTNTAMVRFLENAGFSIKEIADLYNSGKPDVVMVKQLVPGQQLPHRGTI